MDHLDVVTTFLNHGIDNDDIYMTVPEGQPEGLNALKILVRFRKALYRLKQALKLWHNDINTFLLSLGFTQYPADPNLYLRSDGIPIIMYDNDITMSHPEATAKAVIEAKVILSKKYKINNLGVECQFLSIEIHRDRAAVSLRQKVYLIAILK
jgi:hypothetical protein